MHVNADARGGWLRVEVLDENGTRIPGFESTPLSTDALRTPVAWSAGKAESLAGRRVRLQFTLQKAKLYSYWIGDAAQ